MKHPPYFLTILLLLVLLAACTLVETVSTPDETTTDTISASEEAASNSECDDGFRSIDHDFGTTCVPEHPERIAVLDVDIAALMRVLNLKPAAASFTQWNELVAAAPEWGESGERFMADAVDIGDWPYNLETIAASQPDLIVGAWDENYELLSEIAPTIPFDIYAQNSDRWSTFSEFYGNVFNVQEQTQQFIDITNTRIAALGEHIRLEAGNPTVSVVQEWEGNVDYGAPYFAYNQIMAQANIARPAVQDITQTEYEAIFEEYWANVSLEQLETIDADYLLLLSFTYHENGGNIEELNEKPIWATLNAVQDDQFVAVSWQQFVAFDIYSINKTIDDLFRIVGEVDPAEVSPNPFLTGQTDVRNSPEPSTSLALQILETTDTYRLIMHALGETQVPLKPQRVVTLQDQNALLPLFELGFTDVVGSVGILGKDGSSRFRRMQDYDTTQVTYIGEVYSPNLEEIALLNPDLIIGNEWEVTEENYDLLSAIAPTIVVTRGPRSVYAIMSDFALLIDGMDALNTLEARYQERLAEVRSVREASGLVSASLIIFLEDGTLLVDPIGAPTQILQELGFIFPAAQQETFDSGERASFSLEVLPEHDADLLLWPYFDGNLENDRAQELRQSPLWAQLNSVQQGQAQPFDASRWYGSAYQALFNTLDDLEEILSNP